MAVSPVSILQLLLCSYFFVVVRLDSTVGFVPTTTNTTDVFTTMVNTTTRKAGPHFNLHGKPGQGYFIGVNIGTPPQQLNVLIDTGSSNFAVSTRPNPMISTYFDTSKSSSYKDMGTEVNVPYTQGHWQGTLGKDMVTLAALSNVTVWANVAGIESSEDFYMNGSQWQGILGLGYPAIARPDSSQEPLFDSLVSQYNIGNMFCLQLCGTLDSSMSTDTSVGGTMHIGFVDETLYQGDLLYTPLHKEWYYDIIITNIAVDDKSLGMDCKEYNFDKTIVDSGTTNFRLPKRVFAALLDKIKENLLFQEKDPPEGFWEGSEVLCWERNMTPWMKFPYITLDLLHSGNSSFQIRISPQQYLRAVEDPEGDEDEECYKFAVSSSETGTILGAVVMEGFYVVFDRQNKRVGFGETTCRNRDVFGPTSRVSGPFPFNGDAYDCGYNHPASSQSPLMIAAYVMAGICVLCLLPLLFLIIHCQIRRFLNRRRRNSDRGGLLPES